MNRRTHRPVPFSAVVNLDVAHEMFMMGQELGPAHSPKVQRERRRLDRLFELTRIGCNLITSESVEKFHKWNRLPTGKFRKILRGDNKFLWEVLNVPQLIKLVGQNGETATILGHPNDMKLECTFPLRKTVREGREWLKTAFRFFKPLLSEIKRIPYYGNPKKELERAGFKNWFAIREWDSCGKGRKKAPVFRGKPSVTGYVGSRNYAQIKKSYGSVRGRSWRAYIPVRDKWIRDRVNELGRSAGINYTNGMNTVYEIVARELHKLPTGSFGEPASIIPGDQAGQRPLYDLTLQYVRDIATRSG